MHGVMGAQEEEIKKEMAEVEAWGKAATDQRAQMAHIRKADEETGQ